MLMFSSSSMRWFHFLDYSHAISNIFSFSKNLAKRSNGSCLNKNVVPLGLEEFLACGPRGSTYVPCLCCQQLAALRGRFGPQGAGWRLFPHVLGSLQAIRIYPPKSASFKRGSSWLRGQIYGFRKKYDEKVLCTKRDATQTHLLIITWVFNGVPPWKIVWCWFGSWLM